MNAMESQKLPAAEEKTQHTGTKNLTVGNYRRVLLTFALPMFLSMLFQQLYNTVDTFVVGRFLGTQALAAVGSSGSLIMLLVGFFSGATLGGTVVISRNFGAGEMDKVSRAIHTNVALGAISGVAVAIFGVCMTTPLLQWMGTDPNVLDESVKYFRTYFYGVPAVVLYNVCNSVMTAVGDSKRPLYYLIVSSMMNVVLDVLFVGILGLGIEWAAIATVISQATSVMLSFLHLTKPGTVYRVEVSKIRVHRDMMGEVLRHGLPTGFQNSVISFANVLIQSHVNSFGEIAMAAYGTYTKISGFAMLPIGSLSMAMTTFVGQNLGAGEYTRARKGSRFGILTSVILAECIGVCLYLFAPQLMSLFTTDAAVVELGVLQTRTEALFIFLLAFSNCTAGVCRGAGHTMVPTVIMFSIWCVLRVAYITVAMQIRHDIVLLYLAYPITWGISSILYFIYYRGGGWLQRTDML